MLFCPPNSSTRTYVHLPDAVLTSNCVPLELYLSPGVRVHALNLSTLEAEAGEPLSLRPAWFIEQVSGWPGLCRETLTQKNKTKINKPTTKKNQFEHFPLANHHFFFN